MLKLFTVSYFMTYAYLLHTHTKKNLDYKYGQTSSIQKLSCVNEFVLNKKQ